MKISRDQIDLVLEALATKRRLGSREKPALRLVSGGQDTVEPGLELGEYSDVYKLIAGLPEVRQERLAEVADALAKGEYEPTATEVAEKLLGRAIADKLK